MNKIIFWGTTLLVIVASNYLILKKEDTLANGRTMLLRLAPVDPRSLMQGDYMILRYQIAQPMVEEKIAAKGHLVVRLDENDVASVLKFYNGERLKDDEYLLFFRNRGGLRLGAESFLFQEGQAELYSAAQYGELKVDDSGASVLIGLRDQNFKPLGRE